MNLNRQILIYINQAQLRNVVEQLLTCSGYETMLCEGKKISLKCMREAPPLLIITDQGDVVARQFAEFPEIAQSVKINHVPILLLSDDVDNKQQLERTFEIVDDVWLLPIVDVLFLHRVKSLINHFQQKKDSEILAQIFDNTLDGIMITDPWGGIEKVNHGFSQITGYSNTEIKGKNPNVLQSGGHSPMFYKDMWHALQKNGKWEGEITNRRKNGRVYTEWLNIIAIKSEDDVVKHYVGIFSDITIIKTEQENLAQLAHHDPLTYLPNRLLLNERVDQSLAFAKRNNKGFAILYIDLDQFKPVNDQYGHCVGDELLGHVSRRLEESVRETDTVARIGGDEFVILATNINKKNYAETLAKKVLSRLSESFSLQNHIVNISCSIGICLYPDDGANLKQLLTHADAAMYKVKQAGKNNYGFY